MEPRSHFQQAGDAAFDSDFAAGGRGNPGEDSQQSALARAIAANDAEDFALFDLKADILQSPDGVGRRTLGLWDSGTRERAEG